MGIEIAESRLLLQSTIISVRSNILAKILRSCKEGKLIRQESHTARAYINNTYGSFSEFNFFPARLVRADLLLRELEPNSEVCCPLLANIRHPSTNPDYELLQIVLGTNIKNLHLRKLISCDLSLTLSCLQRYQDCDDKFGFPRLYELDTFLESLRCFDHGPASEVKESEIAQRVFTEEFFDPASSEEGEAEFLIWTKGPKN